MQHVSPATARKSAAIAAFDAATALGKYADWRSVAEQLRELVAMPKAKGASDGFAPWADRPSTPYRSAKKHWSTVLYQTTFADGRIVRMSQLDEPGKPSNVGKAVRIARTVWARRAGVLESAAPSIVALACETTGETWSSVTINARAA
jgi:hypothetical protein